jgi:hypothetical protein
LKGTTMKFTMQSVAQAPDGTVLLLGIQYEGMASGKVFTYAALKAAGRWFFTGSGKVPSDAGWMAVDAWLARDGRVVEWVHSARSFDPIWPVPLRPEPDPDATPGSAGADTAP